MEALLKGVIKEGAEAPAADAEPAADGADEARPTGRADEEAKAKREEAQMLLEPGRVASRQKMAEEEAISNRSVPRGPLLWAELAGRTARARTAPMTTQGRLGHRGGESKGDGDGGTPKKDGDGDGDDDDGLALVRHPSRRAGVAARAAAPGAGDSRTMGAELRRSST